MLSISNNLSIQILVIGDLILDHYVEGQVKRISPEAPVPILFQTSERDVLGGAGNVANNIRALGGQASLIGVLGQDFAADRFIDLAKAAGIKLSSIRDGKRNTSQKTRLLGDRQQLLRVDNETLSDVNEALEIEIIDTIRDLMSDVNGVIISDYRKGLLTPFVLQQTIELANALNIPVFVDPKGAESAYYRGATYIKPNRAELELLTGLACKSLRVVEEAAAILIEKTGANVLVTLSQDGMILIDNAYKKFSLPTQAREVFDVSGAGDTAIASFAFAIAQNASPENAARFANIASGIAVSKIGTSAISFEEISAEVKKLYSHNETFRGNHVTLPEATKLREDWRSRGFRVGFTNGCFDLLHPGHISLLRGAAAACDRLIVAINSDASVKRLKGEARPIQSEAARAEVVGALESVDLVVIFDEDTPLEAIEAIKPDVLVKGADYQEDEIVGAAFVKRNGGKVVRVNLRDGHSTTNLVNRSNLT